MVLQLRGCHEVPDASPLTYSHLYRTPPDREGPVGSSIPEVRFERLEDFLLLDPQGSRPRTPVRDSLLPDEVLRETPGGSGEV